MNNDCTQSRVAGNYFIFSQARTIEEESHLNSIDLANLSAEECAESLRKFRKVQRQAQRRGAIPYVVNTGDCDNDIPAPKHEPPELIGCPPGVTTEEWWVIQLRLEGCTFEEIGERMHVNEKTARLKLKSASLKLYKTFLPANDL